MKRCRFYRNCKKGRNCEYTHPNKREHEKNVEEGILKALYSLTQEVVMMREQMKMREQTEEKE